MEHYIAFYITFIFFTFIILFDLSPINIVKFICRDKNTTFGILTFGIHQYRKYKEKKLSERNTLQYIRNKKLEKILK